MQKGRGVRRLNVKHPPQDLETPHFDFESLEICFDNRDISSWEVNLQQISPDLGVIFLPNPQSIFRRVRGRENGRLCNLIF